MQITISLFICQNYGPALLHVIKPSKPSTLPLVKTCRFQDSALFCSITAVEGIKPIQLDCRADDAGSLSRLRLFQLAFGIIFIIIGGRSFIFDLLFLRLFAVGDQSGSVHGAQCGASCPETISEWRK